MHKLAQLYLRAQHRPLPTRPLPTATQRTYGPVILVTDLILAVNGFLLLNVFIGISPTTDTERYTR